MNLILFFILYVLVYIIILILLATLLNPYKYRWHNNKIKLILGEIYYVKYNTKFPYIETIKLIQKDVGENKDRIIFERIKSEFNNQKYGTCKVHRIIGLKSEIDKNIEGNEK